MSVVFDTADLLSTLQPPVFRHRGLEYVGRILSIEEWWRWEERVRLWQETGTDAKAFVALIGEFVDDVFPRPRWYEWGRVPCSVLLASLPFSIQVEAFRSFFGSLASAHTPRTDDESAPVVPHGETTSGATTTSEGEE